MNSNNYTITMPFKDFENYKKIEKELQNLKKDISEAFIPNDSTEIMTVNITKLINIGKKILPLRYQDWNYQEVKF